MDSSPVQPHLPLGTIVDRMYEIKTARAELAKADKVFIAEYDALAVDVMAALDEQEVTMTRAKTASAIITEEEVPKLEDWDAFYKYIADNSLFFLLQRRTNNAAWRELRESGADIPGTVPVRVRKVAVRKA